jgi:hypothetical protein
MHALDIADVSLKAKKPRASVGGGKRKKIIDSESESDGDAGPSSPKPVLKAEPRPKVSQSTYYIHAMSEEEQNLSQKGKRNPNHHPRNNLPLCLNRVQTSLMTKYR